LPERLLYCESCHEDARNPVYDTSISVCQQNISCATGNRCNGAYLWAKRSLINLGFSFTHSNNFRAIG